MHDQMILISVPPTITSKNDAVMQIDEGQSEALLCTATGVPKPNITWVRSDGGMLPGNRGALYRVSLFVHIICHLTLDHIVKCWKEFNPLPDMPILGFFSYSFPKQQILDSFQTQRVKKTTISNFMKMAVSSLTRYQTTNFRLFQVERVCRRQFQI